jgi:hypothetical protein
LRLVGSIGEICRPFRLLMKKILIAFFLFNQALGYSQCYYQIESDRDDLNPQHSVKKVTVKQTYPGFIGTTLIGSKCNDCIDYFYELDSQKKILFAQAYGRDGLPSYQRINEYENGRCVKSIDIYNDSSCNKTMIWKFDSEKRPVYFEARSNDNTLVEVITWQYKDSTFFKMIFFDVKIKYPERDWTKEFAKQILVKRTVRNVYRRVKGNNQLFTKEVENGKARYSSIAKYKRYKDKWMYYSGNISWRGSKRFYKYSFSRNDSISSSTFKDQDGSSETILKYDKMNNTIYQEVIVTKGEKRNSKNIHTWEFIYDLKGNWTKKSEYKDGELQTTIEREITYYD